MRKAPITMSLVRGCIYGGVCHWSAVPMLVGEGSVVRHTGRLSLPFSE